MDFTGLESNIENCCTFAHLEIFIRIHFNLLTHRVWKMARLMATKTNLYNVLDSSVAEDIA